MRPNGSFRYLNNTVKIEISYDDLCAIKHLVNIAPKEAQWFHRLETIRNKHGVIYKIYDIYIPEQYCSVAEVESTDSMMISFYKELLAEHGSAKTNEIMSSLNVWCHSHHNMGTGPSGQDNSQFLEFVKQNSDSGSNNPQIMMIFNKKDEYYSRVYDPKTGFICENIPIEITTKAYEDITLQAKTKFKKPKQSKVSGWGNFGLNGKSKKTTKRKSSATSWDSKYKIFWSKMYPSTKKDIILTVKKLNAKSGHTDMKLLSELKGLILKVFKTSHEWSGFVEFLNGMQGADKSTLELDLWAKHNFEFDQLWEEQTELTFTSLAEAGLLDEDEILDTLFFTTTLFSEKKLEKRESLIDWWCDMSSLALGSPYGERFGGSYPLF